MRPRPIARQMSIDATTLVWPASDGVSYASWGRRLAALAIDAVLLSIAPFLLVVVGYIQGVGEGEENLYAMLDWFIFGIIIAVAFGIVSSAFYFTLLVARNGQTVGKRAVGIAVRDSRDVTQRIGYCGRSPASSSQPSCGRSTTCLESSTVSGRCGTRARKPGTTRFPAASSCASDSRDGRSRHRSEASAVGSRRGRRLRRAHAGVRSPAPRGPC
jgi:hypothetical protein